MITKIQQIKEKKDYLVIYFDYEGEYRFTYLTKDAIRYWQEHRKVKEFVVGDDINVFKVNEGRNFQIVSINGK